MQRDVNDDLTMSTISTSDTKKKRARPKDGGPAVRFSGNDDVVTFTKSPAEDEPAGPPAEEAMNVMESVPVRRKKRPRPERPNPDEIDDIDDFVPEEEGGENEYPASILGESQTLEAKRQRRLKQKHYNDENEENDGGFSTRIDKETSLASEGIPVEAFNMEEERTDGTGYFDGDTYIFRRGGKGGPGVNEEPDAWLDQLNEGADEEDVVPSKRKPDPFSYPKQQQRERPTTADKMDSLSKDELYSRLLPLVSDTETIASALIRYGKLLKNSRQQNNTKNQDTDDSNQDMAKKALNDLTEIASALFLKGEVSVYEQTRNGLLRRLNATNASNGDAKSLTHNNSKVDMDENDNSFSRSDGTSSRPPQDKENKTNETVLWEYQGNGDGQIHGPFTNQQMMGWIQLGYFVGPTAVKVRPVRQGSATNEVVKEKPKSTGDDLLSDLMEDDDDDNEQEKDSNTEDQENSKTTNNNSDQVRGEWIMSDQVDFSQYLC